MSPRRSIRFVVLTLALAGFACSGRHGREPTGETEGTNQGRQSLTIKGSDTMVILAQKWAERFMQVNEGVAVQVSGGGSGTGLAALLNGTTDLADSSRPIKDREREQLRSTRHLEAVEFRVALDALAIYVHESSPIRSLTLAQIKAIYRGETTNWSAVGGPNAPIVLYSRENNSGTYAYFKEHVLDDEDFAAAAQTLQGTAAVISAVGRDPGGIGYGGIAYGSGVRAIAIKLESGEGVEPTMANATSGRYPISRFLYVYSAGEPSQVARRYLDFVLSAEGQALVEGVGYYPLPREQAAAPTPSPTPAATAPTATP